MPTANSIGRGTPKRRGFKVAARTLLHLGRDLITSDEIALNELIKNAYDAGSPRVEIFIHACVPKYVIDKLLQAAAKATRQSLSAVAAETEVSLRERAFELAGEAAERFDRLATRIGQSHDVALLKELLERVNMIEVRDTGHGIPRAQILPVFLTVGTDFKKTNPPSRDGEEFLGNKGIGRLAMMRLGDRAEVLTWQTGASAAKVAFDWRDFDRGDIELSKVPVTIRRSKAPLHADSGTRIRIYSLRRDWEPGPSVEAELQDYFRRLRNPFVTSRRFPIRISINGAPTLPFPPMAPKLQGAADQELLVEFSPKASSGYALMVTTTPQGGEPEVERRTMRELAQSLQEAPSALSDIGPFVLRLKRFNRTSMRARFKGEWPELRKELDIWTGGIAIYRDGFRVGFTGSGTGEDWLGLDAKALRGGGYSVNRIQVVGTLEISQSSNPGLVDLTNREGLISTPEAKLLRKVLLERAITPLKHRIEALEETAKAQRMQHMVEDGVPTLMERVQTARGEVSTLLRQVPEQLRSPVRSIEQHLHFVSTQIKDFEAAVEKAHEGREDILELASVGNVMHGVLHELTRTTGQTRRLLAEVARDAGTNTRELLEKLEDEIRAINVRLRQLDPLTPSGRHIKKEIEVDRLIGTIMKGHEKRFLRHGIDFSGLRIEGRTPFRVRMVPGFLSLVVENLVSNSVHWIKQEGTLNGERGRIEVELDTAAATLTYSDNGPGIAYADRERVFSPGWSLKPKGKGYGLFLAREVAQFHDCQLFLDPSPDADGRLRTFVFQLPRGAK